jgi:hypothetical protein
MSAGIPRSPIPNQAITAAFCRPTSRPIATLPFRDEIVNNLVEIFVGEMHDHLEAVRSPSGADVLGIAQ